MTEGGRKEQFERQIIIELFVAGTIGAMQAVGHRFHTDERTPMACPQRPLSSLVGYQTTQQRELTDQLQLHPSTPGTFDFGSINGLFTSPIQHTVAT